MIDHVSIAVKDLKSAGLFYSKLLAVIGYKILKSGPTTIGYGKKYPEFWLNERRNIDLSSASDGFHVCLRAKSVSVVNEFHEQALKIGGTDDGKPGYRAEYNQNYYAAFIKDIEGNKIEVVTFT